MITLDVVNIVLIPAVMGLLIPLATAWVEQYNLPIQLETFLNIALSALAASVPTLYFNGSWQEYFVALAVAWLATMRSHYTQLPSKLWTSAPTGKHAARTEENTGQQAPF